MGHGHHCPFVLREKMTRKVSVRPDFLLRRKPRKGFLRMTDGPPRSTERLYASEVWDLLEYMTDDVWFQVGGVGG
jgi:hypothetical protein